VLTLAAAAFRACVLTPNPCLAGALPARRPSAAALVAFLSHAGYRMAAVYGRQFTKLLQHMVSHFLPALEAKAVKNPGALLVWCVLSEASGSKRLREQESHLREEAVEPTPRSLRAFCTPTDLRAVGTRLHAYVATQAYREEPEGRTLKKVDESQYLRA
jgi:hypothetical protein